MLKEEITEFEESGMQSIRENDDNKYEIEFFMEDSVEDKRNEGHEQKREILIEAREILDMESMWSYRSFLRMRRLKPVNGTAKDQVIKVNMLQQLCPGV